MLRHSLGDFNNFNREFNRSRRRFNIIFSLSIGFICLSLLITTCWWLFVGSMAVNHGDSIIQAIINLINAGANHLNGR
jgi:hypothetical protein